MANPVVRGLQGLTRFEGRDSRGQFWPYAGAVFALVFICSGAAMAWVLADVFGQMQAFALAHPEATSVTTGPGRVSVRIDAGAADAPVPELGLYFATLAATVLLAVLLLAAAVCRRLHDSGRAGWWGLAPLPFLLFGLTAFPMMMADFSSSPEPDMDLFFAIFVNNVIYMVVLVTLIVLLVQRSAPTANRYGEPPVS